MAEKEIKHAGSDRVKRSYFDKSRREEYTILIPDMLPIHFKLIMAIYKKYGYNMELLQNCSRNVIDEGLKTHIMTLAILRFLLSDSLWTLSKAASMTLNTRLCLCHRRAAAVVLQTISTL